MLTIQAPVILEKVQPLKDKSWKLTVATRELGGKDIQALGDLLGSEGYFAFSPNPEDVDNFQAPTEKADAGMGETKSLSERLYNTLYAYWFYANKPGDDFDIWRKSQMERLMNLYKDKMPERK